jgi:hypothetical protein
MTSFFLASFSFSAILLVIIFTKGNIAKKGIILYFIGILSIVLGSTILIYSYRSQTSFTLVLLRLQEVQSYKVNL